MTLLAPIPLATIATLAAVLGAMTVLAYVLKMRRRRFEVPFSTLWQRVLREKEATSLWKQLKRLLSLLLSLLILGLLLFAATGPRLGAADRDAVNMVVIVDASASMKTRDGPHGETRMQAAKQVAHAIVAAMSGGDAAMVVRMDGRTTPLTRFESDVPSLQQAVTSIKATDTPADLQRALSAAADALRGRRHPLIVIVGDGAYPKAVRSSVVWKRGAGKRHRIDAVDLSGIDVRFAPVGSATENVGIVGFNVRRYLADKTSYEVFIDVQNFGKRPARRKLVLYSGDTPIDVRDVSLAPGERQRKIYPNLSGGNDRELRAVLQPAKSQPGNKAAATVRDAFPLDDQAFALLPPRKRQRVLLVTDDNLYLEGAMLVYDNIVTDKLTPEAYESALGAGTLPRYDAVVFDAYTPKALPPPPTDLVYFDPHGADSPFPIARTLEHPHITDVASRHPVMRWVVMNDVNFDKASVFRLDPSAGEVALARSLTDPIIAAKQAGGRKVVAFGFNLRATDLVLRVAFPLLLVNTLDWFAGNGADLITTYATGHRVSVPIPGAGGASEAVVRAPSGKMTPVPITAGHATFYASRVGIHRLEVKRHGRVVAEVDLAANLSNPAESNIAPVRKLVLGGVALRPPGGFHVAHRRAIWRYLVVLALLLLASEWLTFNRRITV